MGHVHPFSRAMFTGFLHGHSQGDPRSWPQVYSSLESKAGSGIGHRGGSGWWLDHIGSRSRVERGGRAKTVLPVLQHRLMKHLWTAGYKENRIVIAGMLGLTDFWDIKQYWHSLWNISQDNGLCSPHVTPFHSSNHPYGHLHFQHEYFLAVLGTIIPPSEGTSHVAWPWSISDINMNKPIRNQHKLINKPT